MTFQEMDYLRRIYGAMMETYQVTGDLFHVYDIYDWNKIFSPIEKNVWHDIRTIGLPLYPQFPVKQYFIDFADPIKKIGIEVDGKKWHSDLEKDQQRQREIEHEGWEIYRIDGKDTFKDRDACFDNCQHEQDERYGNDEFNQVNCPCLEKYAETSEFLIRYIANLRYRKFYPDGSEKKEIKFFSLDELSKKYMDTYDVKQKILAKYGL